MKSPISELDYGKELFGQNLPDRRYNPNWKKLIPNDEPNTDDENKALTLLKKWYDDETIQIVKDKESYLLNLSPYTFV